MRTSPGIGIDRSLAAGALPHSVVRWNELGSQPNSLDSTSGANQWAKDKPRSRYFLSATFHDVSLTLSSPFTDTVCRKSAFFQLSKKVQEFRAGKMRSPGTLQRRRT
jgi:hypothetical protein